MALLNILSKSQFIDNAGYIYPIKVKDYDLLHDELKYPLMFGMENFRTDELPLLYMVIYGLMSINNTDAMYKPQAIAETLTSLFELVTHKKWICPYIGDGSDGEIREPIFVSEDNKNFINHTNYNQVRDMIMHQNLLFTPKVYKDAITQEWANMTLMQKMKNAPNIGIEDMMITIRVFTGDSYETLEEMSIYQLHSDFYKIRDIKTYDADVFLAPHREKAEIKDFAEHNDLHKNPYDEVFVKKEKKLDKLNKAMG